MFAKKVSLKRTPLRNNFVHKFLNENRQSLPSSSRQPSIYNAINIKPISVEEHNKVLIQNQRLAKENALLKTHLNNYKENHRKVTNENVELIQRLNNSETQLHKLNVDLKNKEVSNVVQISDRIKYAINLLMDDYLDVDAIKLQINEFGNKVETIKGIMSSLQAMMENENQFNRKESDLNSDRFDSFCSTNELNGSALRRFSLSTQEQDSKRRMSSDKIKRDFQVLSELSTILELSKEHRISSFGFIEDQTLGSGINIEGPMTTTTTTTAITASTSSTTVTDFNITTESSKVPKSKKRNTKPKPKKELSTKNTNKNKTSNVKQLKSKVNSNSRNDSLISIFDFNEDENKENVPPLPLVPKRQSRRIRAKNAIP